MTVATRPEHVVALVAQRPEAMVVDPSGPEFAERLAGADAVVLGPGLGRGDWGRRCFDRIARAGLPTVLDADGLYWLETARDWTGGELYLTPHPGEAARLLGCDVPAIESARIDCARQLADRYRAAVVLKGPGSVIAGRGQSGICMHGNAGMATAGMGDTLAGIAGALLAGAVRANLSDTARAGLFAQAVALHSAAADRAAAELGPRSLLAGDVVAALPGLLPR